MRPKRILAIHDLSCCGCASLGIALPVLTAFGYQVVALPTVLLSSTTDIDQDPIALATTEWMVQVINRWREQKLKFDAIYTGWLGDPRQVAILINLFRQQPQETTIFVDPVLGDGGTLYPSQAELVKTMNNLVGYAQVITPNPTEAAILLKKQSQDCSIGEDGTISVDSAQQLIEELASVYPKTLPIIKSVVSQNQIGVCVRFTHQNTAQVKKSSTEIILGPKTIAPPIGGTGDLFACLLIGRWLKSISNSSTDQDKLAVIESVIATMSTLMQTIQSSQITDLAFRKLLYCT